MTEHPQWIAYLSPALQLTTALLAAWVAYKFGTLQASIARQQAETARNRLKFDLFDRRMVLYERIYTYIDRVVADGKIDSELDSAFLKSISPLGWLTGPETAHYVFKELRKKMQTLSELTVQIETTATPGDLRVDLLMRQSVLKMDLYQEHDALAKVFAPYLMLGH